MAKPTLTSAAATIIMKKTKICALVAIEALKAFTPAMCIFENATSNKFTEFSISSMHIKTMIELRLVSAPIMPMQNKAIDKNRYHLISIIYNFTYRPIPAVLEAGAIEKISLIFFTSIPLKISTAL